MIESAARRDRVDSSSASPAFLWEVPEKPVSVSLTFDLIDRMEREVVEGFRSLTSRGSEIGGLLLGRALPGVPARLSVEDFETVECDYSRGPLYRLSDADLGRLERTIEQRAESGGPDVVGFFRSHTRKGLTLDAEDLAFMEAHLREPHQIALLVRPFATKASIAGIFIREDGVIRGDASYLEFPFRTAQLAMARKEAPPGRAQIVPIAPRREMSVAPAVPVEERAVPRAIEPEPTPPVAAPEPTPEVAEAIAAPEQPPEPVAIGPAAVDPAVVEPVAVGSTSIEPASIEPASVGPTSIKAASIEPPSVGPTSIEPPSVGPTSIKAPSIEPPSVEPASIEPASIEPPSVGPTSIEPAPIEPASTGPASIEPASVKPVAIEPASIELVSAKPVAVEPAAVEPAAKLLNRRLGLIAAVAGALVISLVLLLFMRHSGTGSIPETNAEAASLGLRAEHTGADLLLTWNRDAAAIQNAARAVLSVSDGGRQESYEMDVNQLRTGSIVYAPLTTDVSFRLDLTAKDQRTTTATVRMLRTRPSPMPAEAQPQAGAAAKPAAEPANTVAAEDTAATDAANTEVAPPSRAGSPVKPFDTSSLAARLHPVRTADQPDAPSLGGGMPVTPKVSTDTPSFAAMPMAPAPAPPPAPAAAPPAADRKTAPQAVGGRIQQSELLFHRDPVYPVLARQLGTMGTVELLATIGTDGRVKAVKVLRGHPVLAKAATDAVMQWIYRPTLLNGVPVVNETKITLNFQGR